MERHRSDFLNLIENDLDFVIGNEDEIKSLFKTEDVEKALEKTSKCALWSFVQKLIKGLLQSKVRKE